MNAAIVGLYEPMLRARTSEPPLPPLSLSVELFPPRTAEAEESFWLEVAAMREVAPAFFSVTCGAGGIGRADTLPLVLELRRRFAVEVAAHITGAGHSRQEVDALARAYWQAGIRHLVALRGDPLPRTGPYRPRPDG